MVNEGKQYSADNNRRDTGNTVSVIHLQISYLIDIPVIVTFVKLFTKITKAGII